MHAPMPLYQLTYSLATSLTEALAAGEIVRAEHLASALLRTRRDWIAGLVLQGEKLQQNTDYVIDSGSYCQREYLVTAIISTYKAERFLKGRLENLLNQTIANQLEILVIDSNSPEHEGDIVRDFQQKADNIRYIRTNRRESVYQAWNRGVDLATGAFLTNANTDDRLCNTALERLAGVLQKNPAAGFAYADFWITQHENESLECNHAHDVTQRPAYSLNRLLENCITGSQPVWRKNLHTTIGRFDTAYNSAADYDFFIRSACHAQGAAIHEPLGLVLTSPTTFSGIGQLPTVEFYAIRERYCHLLRPTGATTSLTEEEQAMLTHIRAQNTVSNKEIALLPTSISPAFSHELGLLYQEQGNEDMAWRYLQRAFYLAPEVGEYRKILECCLERNLARAVREFALTLCRAQNRDTLLSIALAAAMLHCRATSAWLYAQALAQQPDDIVSLINLKRMLLL